VRRLVSALVTTTLAAGLLTVAPAAWADGCPDPGEPITGVSPTPDDVVLGPLASTSTRVFVDGYAGCFSPFENPYVRVLTPHRELIVDLSEGPPPFDGGVEYEGQLTIDTSELEDADAGTWVLSFEAEGRRYAERTFSVRRASTLSFDAGPEPVRRKVTFAGKLRLASWERSRFEGVKGERVRVLRLGPVEAPNPRRVALLTTRKKGRYANKQPFPGTDRYQATYAGTAAVAAVTSRVDAVRSRG
jgi:hypothetical protein